MSYRLVVASTLLLILSSAPAVAQECGDWRYPVLCRAELQVSRDRGDWQRLDAELDLGPGERVEIRLAGRDQWGRDFRSDRLMLGIDDRDCGRVVEVDDRGRAELELEAATAEGRCRLGVWVPGNLNFEWELEVTVAPEARTGYTRSEAEFVAGALYRGILGRDAEAGGLAGAVAEIERGRLESQIEAMVRSDEFRQSLQGVGSEELVERFTRGLLGRAPTSDEVRRATDRLRRGNYADVVLELVRSAEFEERLQQRG